MKFIQIKEKETEKLTVNRFQTKLALFLQLYVLKLRLGNLFEGCVTKSNKIR